MDIESSYNLILRNSFSWNGWGFYSFLTSNNTIIGNRVHNNNEHGIYLDETSHSIVSDNLITHNQFGLDLGYSENNTIVQNSIRSNIEEGLRVHFGYNNTIYHNNFENNTKQVGTTIGHNIWDDGYPSGGNYWDDYNGTDADGDGIGDNPYLIPDTEDQDMYPLMEPYEQTELEIGPISGGLFKIKAEIRNIGWYDAIAIKWTITIGGRVWSGEISRISPGDSAKISTGFLLGFGRYAIMMTAEASNAQKVTKTLDGLIILFFVIIR